eukprot:1223855-Amphidinium_carterae.1
MGESGSKRQCPRNSDEEESERQVENPEDDQEHESEAQTEGDEAHEWKVRRVKELYQTHQPQKLVNVKQYLTKYRANLMQLIWAMESKYEGHLERSKDPAALEETVRPQPKVQAKPVAVADDTSEPEALPTGGPMLRQ